MRDLVGIKYEGDYPHLPLAAGAEQGIHPIDPPDHPGPGAGPPGAGRMLQEDGGHPIIRHIQTQRLYSPILAPLAPGGAGVKPQIANQGFPGIGNMQAELVQKAYPVEHLKVSLPDGVDAVAAIDHRARMRDSADALLRKGGVPQITGHPLQGIDLTALKAALPMCREAGMAPVPHPPDQPLRDPPLGQKGLKDPLPEQEHDGTRIQPVEGVKGPALVKTAFGYQGVDVRACLCGTQTGAS